MREREEREKASDHANIKTQQSTIRERDRDRDRERESSTIDKNTAINH